MRDSEFRNESGVYIMNHEKQIENPEHNEDFHSDTSRRYHKKMGICMNKMDYRFTRLTK